MRIVIVFSSILIVTSALITIGTTEGSETRVNNKTNSNIVDIQSSSITSERQVVQDPPGTIDGSVTPDLIPDEVAYSLFFNFVAGRGTEKEKNNLKAYMQQVQLGDVDLEALVSIAQEYQTSVKDIEAQQSALAGTHYQNLATIENQLKELQERRHALLSEKVQLLQNRLGKAGAANVQRHVMEYIKTKVKIIPGPRMPDAR